MNMSGKHMYINRNESKEVYALPFLLMRFIWLYFVSIVRYCWVYAKVVIDIIFTTHRHNLVSCY